MAFLHVSNRSARRRASPSTFLGIDTEGRAGGRESTHVTALSRAVRWSFCDSFTILLLGLCGLPSTGQGNCASMSVAAGGAVPENGVRSLIPARIDRLPWSPFHTRMVAALGVAWILDGLEISIASAVGETLTKPETLGLSSTEVGLLATVYLVGEVVGALVFGALSDRLGRRNLFTIALAIYSSAAG
jgi:hypothetical protein